MAALERVKEMQRQGIPDEAIAQRLAEEGVSPREINDSMFQSKVKSAVAPSPPGAEEMTGSIMQQEQPQQMQQQGQEQYQEQYAQAQQAYAPEQYQYQQPSSEMTTEIVDSLISEKLGDMSKKLLILDEARKSSEVKLSSINERLKKVENIIDELHAAIIKRMGEYGENIKGISSEIRGMQDNFSKVINPLVDKSRAAKPRPAVSEAEETAEEPSLEGMIKRKKK